MVRLVTPKETEPEKIQYEEYRKTYNRELIHHEGFTLTLDEITWTSTSDYVQLSYTAVNETDQKLEFGYDVYYLADCGFYGSFQRIEPGETRKFDSQFNADALSLLGITEAPEIRMTYWLKPDGAEEPAMEFPETVIRHTFTANYGEYTPWNQVLLDNEDCKIMAIGVGRPGDVNVELYVLVENKTADILSVIDDSTGNAVSSDSGWNLIALNIPPNSKYLCRSIIYNPEGSDNWSLSGIIEVRDSRFAILHQQEVTFDFDTGFQLKSIS